MSTIPMVRDLMVESVISVRPEMPVYEALDLLIAKQLAGIPVIDDEDRLVGFLTEKDCLRLQVNSHHYNMTGRTVKDIMSGITQGLSPDMDLLSASMVFLATNFATLPVLEDDGHIGSLSRQHMLAAIQQWHRARGVDKQSDKHAQSLQDNPSSIDQLQSLVGRSSKAQLASVLRNRHSEN